MFNEITALIQLNKRLSFEKRQCLEFPAETSNGFATSTRSKGPHTSEWPQMGQKN